MLMPEINEAIRCDSHNAVEAHRLLARFDPGLPEALETGLQLHNILRERHSQQPPVDQLTEEGALRLATGILLLLSWRTYLWLVTDLLTLKVSSALGKLRTQIEAAGLLAEFISSPSRAQAWLAIETHDEGRQFFRDTQGAVREHVRNSGLDHAYSMGSHVALHPRFQSALLGITVSDLSLELGNVTQMSLSLQECITDPSSLVMFALYILTSQAAILDMNRASLPSCDDGILAIRIRQWRQQIVTDVRLLRERYPRFDRTDAFAAVATEITRGWEVSGDDTPER